MESRNIEYILWGTGIHFKISLTDSKSDVRIAVEIFQE